MCADSVVLQQRRRLVGWRAQSPLPCIAHTHTHTTKSINSLIYKSLHLQSTHAHCIQLLLPLLYRLTISHIFFFTISPFLYATFFLSRISLALIIYSALLPVHLEMHPFSPTRNRRIWHFKMRNAAKKKKSYKMTVCKNSFIPTIRIKSTLNIGEEQRRDGRRTTPVYRWI